MPVREGRLACFPAQIDGPPIAQRWKIQQSKIDIFHDAAIRLDTIHQSYDLGFELGESPCRATISNPLRPAATQCRIELEQFDRKLTPLEPQLL